MEVKYIIAQKNANTNSELGVQVDMNGSIYMLEIDRAYRFSQLETAKDIKTILEKVNATINSNYIYTILKETREDVSDGTTTVE